MLCGHTVRHLAPAQRMQRGHDSLKIVEAVDCDCDHLHQLAALIAYVAMKQAAQRWVHLEQPVVQQRARLIREWRYARKAVADEVLQLRCHVRDLPATVGTTCARAASAHSR